MQEERAELRGACTAKDAQIVTLEVEVRKIPQLREELQQAKVSEGGHVIKSSLSKHSFCTIIILHTQTEKASCDAVIAAKELEIADKDRSLITLQQTCATLQTQLSSLWNRIQALEVSIVGQLVEIVITCTMCAHAACQQLALKLF